MSSRTRSTVTVSRGALAVSPIPTLTTCWWAFTMCRWVCSVVTHTIRFGALISASSSWLIGLASLPSTHRDTKTTLPPRGEWRVAHPDIGRSDFNVFPGGTLPANPNLNPSSEGVEVNVLWPSTRPPWRSLSMTNGDHGHRPERGRVELVMQDGVGTEGTDHHMGAEARRQKGVGSDTRQGDSPSGSRRSAWPGRRWRSGPGCPCGHDRAGVHDGFAGRHANLRRPSSARPSAHCVSGVPVRPAHPPAPRCPAVLCRSGPRVPVFLRLHVGGRWAQTPN